MSNDLPQRMEAAPLPESAETCSPADEFVRAQDQLKRLNRLFGVALNNMARGLSAFDADQRLIVCNQPYAEIYGLPEDLTRAGTPFASITRHLLTQEAVGDDSAELEPRDTSYETHLSKLAGGETVTCTRHLKDGRTVHVTSQPLTDGGWVDIHDCVGERRKGEERINWLAHNDPLTEVANPLYFGEELENALRQLKLGVAFAVHWIDLDRFAELNDTFGHAVGDAVLRSVAERLATCVRTHDLVARLGGDEFAIIQAGVKTQAEAERLAQRLLRAISAPYDILGNKISMSASIGVVLAPEHGTSSLELIKNVYLALYAAKAGGRDTYAMFKEGRHLMPNEHGVVAGRTSASTDR